MYVRTPQLVSLRHNCIVPSPRVLQRANARHVSLLGNAHQHATHNIRIFRGNASARHAVEA